MLLTKLGAFFFLRKGIVLYQMLLMKVAPELLPQIEGW